MNFRLYFIVILIFGIFSYCLNWNSLCNIDPNCSVDILNTSNKLLFTSSIVLSALSFISIFKTNDNIVFYPIIFLIIALVFIVLSIINLVNGKQLKNSISTTTTPATTTTPVTTTTPATTTPVTTTPVTTTPIKLDENIYTECVSNITSVLNLLIGIIIGMISIYYLKNEIFKF
jgi:hypothetical protein